MADTTPQTDTPDLGLDDLDGMSGGINPQPLPPNHPPEGGPHVE
jgi:hypothetical protein